MAAHIRPAGNDTARNSAIGSRSRLALGIRGKLAVAFGAVASLTLVASAVAFVSYRVVGNSLAVIETDSLPGMTHAFTLARQAAELSSLSSMIAAATNAQELAGTDAARERTFQGMNASLDGLQKAELGRKVAAKLRGQVDELNGSVKQLTTSVSARFEASTRREQIVKQITAAHTKLAEGVAPLLDDASFNMVLGLRNAGDNTDREKVKADLESLAEKEAIVMEGAAELRAESNLLLGILSEISLAPSEERLRPLRDRLTSATNRAVKAVEKLGKTDEAEKLNAALKSLIALDAPNTGVTSERQRELKAIAESWRLVGVARSHSTALGGEVDAAVSAARTEMSSNVAESSHSIDQSKQQLMFILLATAGVLLGVWMFVGAAILKRLQRLNGAIVGLAKGDLAVEVPKSGSDEITEMAHAVETFKANAVAKARLEQETEESNRRAEAERQRHAAQRAEEARQLELAIDELGKGLANLSKGNLVYRITVPFAENVAKLRTDFNTSVETLQNSLLEIAGSVETIRTGTNSISSSTGDIAKRTERQAATLEETTANLGEVTSTVRHTADSAKHAQEIATGTKDAAEKGGAVMREAVSAMAGIEKSSNQISQIIGVIDEIAFQTNLLALNAGVEAARAGDAGRGFAVVASEVRALAQRSASAAKEIKELISKSAYQVEEGSALIRRAGEALGQILGMVADINSSINDIAKGASEQATSLQGVNSAVADMDKGTQQNAAVVEEAAAAAEALAQEADSLASLTQQFQLGGGRTPHAVPQEPVVSTRPVPRAAAKLAPVRKRARAGAAVAVAAGSDADWQEF